MKIQQRYLHISPCKLILLALLGIMSSCTGLKYIDQSDPLLGKQEIIWPKEKGAKDQVSIKDDIESILVPKSVNKFLWMRPTLVAYNVVGDTSKDKGVKYWLKYKIGTPPVLLSTANAENVSQIIKNRLQINGYFHAEIDHNIQFKRKQAKIEYAIHPGSRYTIGSVSFPEDSLALERNIKELENQSLIIPGNPYRLQDLIDEKDRLEYSVRDSGFYFFNSQYLHFTADTTNLGHKVNLKLNIVPNIPAQARSSYSLNRIFIFDDFALVDYRPDTSYYKSFIYISQYSMFKKGVITQRIFLKPGENYSRYLQTLSQKQLMNLGTYRFVTFKFLADSSSNTLDSYIYMTPTKRKSISAEVNAVARNTNYVGPMVKLTHRNRNLRGGAENFSYSFEGSFEVQIGSDTINTAYNFGIDTEFRLPNLYPFRHISLKSNKSSNTQMNLGFNIFRRLELYSLQSLHGGYSLNFYDLYHHNRIRLLELSYVRTANITETFRDYLEQNPSVKKSFENNFIMGISYAYTLNKLSALEARHNFFFSSHLETAGNMLYGFNRFTSKHEHSPDNPYTILGVPFAQYTKAVFEYRYYLDFKKGGLLASKLKAGIGTPMGNSSVLPYIKQFYAGGTNSVRAFVSRSLGPGSYTTENYTGYIDQTGDILIEGSLEYRFSLIKMLKGAVFADAGNVWLARPDEDREGANFELNRFWKEFGLGTGFGLRFDASFFVIRLDLATPLYKPDTGWVMADNNAPPGGKKYDKLLLNIAIGYPF